jgi:hypothetical protein
VSLYVCSMHTLTGRQTHTHTHMHKHADVRSYVIYSEGITEIGSVWSRIHERLFSPRGMNKWEKFGKLTKNDTFFTLYLAIL